MKQLVKILFLFFACTSTQHIFCQNNVIDEIVWVVGDEAILKSEVEEYRKEILMQNQRIEGDPYCFIPEQIAINKLFLDQAKLDSIQVQEREVNRIADLYINEYISNIGSAEKVEEYFQKDMASIREDTRKMVREQQLIQNVQQKHFGDVNLSPSEIRKFYNKIPQDSVPFIPTTIEVQIVTVNPKIPLSVTDAIKARLRDFTEQINSGKNSFSTLALLYSEDPASAVRGGELGFSDRSSFVPEFANVAFSLTDPNKVSNIVETEYGFHIIQLIERRGDRANFRHILLKPKVPQEELDSAMIRLDSIKTLIDTQKITFEEAATFFSADKDTRNNKGIMVNTNRQSNYYGTPRFQLNELNQDIANVVGNMKVGEVSKPFIMIDKNGSGKQVAAIVKVTNRVEGHKANLNNDYQVIKSMAENARKQEMIDEWLREKIKTTYVRIDPEWQNCKFKYDGWLK
ncbi:MAG: Chaperone SurA precursor [Bacteroidetes bacterium ADurb.BinA261]|jgi:peptidyl-prolyl cis-trans isomerase SurA|nr:MAG: Chaperone SurA precursor [Bacteroidetes bacterium ADurb.BinA261]